MSVRAFKAARASNARAGSVAMYAPRAQKTFAKRKAIADAIAKKQSDKRKQAAELIAKIQGDRYDEKPNVDYLEAAKRHVARASDQQLDRIFDIYDESEDFYIPDSDWYELGFLLYYRD